MEDDGDRMEVDEKAASEELPVGPVTFEEMLLLRLAFELNRSTRDRRTQYYLDRLDEIVPESLSFPESLSDEVLGMISKDTDR